MKFKWRVTKYNPCFRDINGIYQKDEWTSIHHIGKVYDNKEFTLEEYLKKEDCYIQAIEQVLNFNKIESLIITGLEKWGKELEIDEFHKIYSQNMFHLYRSIYEGYSVRKNDISDLCRLILRNQLWCKLNNSKIYIHFGHDYYMFIGCEEACNNLENKIRKIGLFVENWISPIN